MPKVFYTETDIRAMAERGVKSLDLDAGVTLTDLAREKARELGVELVRGGTSTAPHTPPDAAPADLAQRIRSAVAARLGDRVEPALLDTIIERVLSSTGLK